MSHKKKEMENEAEKPAILFSFDGTLFDTEPAIIACYRQVFSQFGKEKDFTRERQMKVLDASVTKMMQEFFPKKDTEKCVQCFDTYEKDHLIDLIQPRSGAKDLLIWLKENGYKTGIVSMRERSSIVSLLRYFGFAGWFDTILGGSSIHSDYVSAADIQLACRLMHASTAVFVGDSASDVVAAREAGAFSIAIAANSYKAPSIVAENPDFVTGDLHQIRKLLSGEPLWLAYHVVQPDELEKEKRKAEKKEKKSDSKSQKKKKKEKVRESQSEAAPGE